MVASDEEHDLKITPEHHQEGNHHHEHHHQEDVHSDGCAGGKGREEKVGLEGCCEEDAYVTVLKKRVE